MKRIFTKDWKFLFERFILHKHIPAEPEVLKAVSGITGDLFVDVGANSGLYSIMLSPNFQRVYAFEPNPEVLPIMRQRIENEQRNNITIFPIALSDFNGETPLYLDSHEGFCGSSETILPVFKYDPGHDNRAGPAHTYLGKESVTVPMATYDSMVREKADLVKIDVEGAEFKVLRGAKESLEKGNIRIIVVELHDKSDKNQMYDLLLGYGFSLKQLDNHPRLFGALER